MKAPDNALSLAPMYELVYVDEASSALTYDRDTGMSIIVPRHFRVWLL